ncbi:hypothetical protein PPROV_000385900 [Pycnococcus provasolii]|uniref:non-specific protein-tyrosine kinase n=1 Tax=Pycnococcus provasolii TaxID=41880 RepID=A0A830HJ95_9CHLO|nr:hypothetical protein PPROV_000385900 [Pycnococcus provasolii]
MALFPQCTGPLFPTRVALRLPLFKLMMVALTASYVVQVANAVTAGCKCSTLGDGKCDDNSGVGAQNCDSAACDFDAGDCIAKYKDFHDLAMDTDREAARGVLMACFVYPSPPPSPKPPPSPPPPSPPPSPPPPSPPPPSPPKKKGDAAGIAVGVIFAVIVLCVAPCAWSYYRRKVAKDDRDDTVYDMVPVQVAKAQENCLQDFCLCGTSAPDNGGRKFYTMDYAVPPGINTLAPILVTVPDGMPGAGQELQWKKPPAFSSGTVVSNITYYYDDIPPTSTMPAAITMQPMPFATTAPMATAAVAVPQPVAMPTPTPYHVVASGVPMNYNATTAAPPPPPQQQQQEEQQARSIEMMSVTHLPPPPPHQPEVAIPMPTSIGGDEETTAAAAEDEKDMVLALLTSVRLDKYASAFEELGLRDVQDFYEVTDDDLTALGMSELEKRRFKSQVQSK